MTDPSRFNYSEMRGLIDNEKATSLAAPGEPCHKLLTNMRADVIHALDEGATPEEIIGMINLEAMRMENKMLNTMLQKNATMRDLLEDEVDT